MRKIKICFQRPRSWQKYILPQCLKIFWLFNWCKKQEKTSSWLASCASSRPLRALSEQRPIRQRTNTARGPLIGSCGHYFLLASEKTGSSRRYTTRIGLRRTRDGPHGLGLQVACVFAFATRRWSLDCQRSQGRQTQALPDGHPSLRCLAIRGVPLRRQ